MLVMNNKRKKTPQKANEAGNDKSHRSGFTAMVGLSKNEIVAKLQADGVSLQHKVLDDNVPANEQTGLLELAKLLCHCVNVGIPPERLAKFSMELLKFCSEADVKPSEGYESLGLEVVQGLLVKYLFAKPAEDHILEILPNHKTRLKRLEAPRDEPGTPGDRSA